MRATVHIQTAVTPERMAAVVVDSGAISVALELSLAQLDGVIEALQRVRADMAGGVVLLGPNGAPVSFEHRQAELGELEQLERIAAQGGRGFGG